MKNINSVVVKTAILCALLMLAWTTACQTNTANSSSSSNSTANQSTNTTAPVNADKTETKPAAVNTNQTQPAKTETATTHAAGSLATPTEAYKTAYAARKNKDVAGLKRVMSKDMIEFFSVIVEGQNKTIDDVLTELSETPQNPSNESRNEKITGDRATLEYLDVKGDWKTMDFVKDGGDWKLTMPKAVSTDNAPPAKKNK